MLNRRGFFGAVAAVASCGAAGSLPGPTSGRQMARDRRIAALQARIQPGQPITAQLLRDMLEVMTQDKDADHR